MAPHSLHVCTLVPTKAMLRCLALTFALALRHSSEQTLACDVVVKAIPHWSHRASMARRTLDAGLTLLCWYRLSLSARCCGWRCFHLATLHVLPQRVGLVPLPRYARSTCLPHCSQENDSIMLAVAIIEPHRSVLVRTGSVYHHLVGPLHLSEQYENVKLSAIHPIRCAAWACRLDRLPACRHHGEACRGAASWPCPTSAYSRPYGG